ncbi:FadR/GntR family transcriptional regulator [Desulfovibrio ferrophilus]|uniref:Regulatory protein GntR HTH n=1 Tax=Desulfovibrio ferrophilus TaxID=241368 RepID=A0A2Z6AX03_9BACT|nr:GntR family transcriptional regulator [Desulfovibrio ferrophilus]BBD07728.1 regulatory protein GntR HTH [Desulfovibrio ferrophilus]
MSKKEQALKQLGQIIMDLELKAGDRLPSERKLATKLGVSRNTLHGILHSLEARGLLKIRPGSGCYLRVRISGLQDNPLDITLSPEKVVADQLEAAYMLLPMVAEHAASHIGERQLDELKRCSVDISRSIFQKSPELVWNESLTYFRLMAMGTGNDFLVRTVEQICSCDMAAYDIFFTLEREEREAIFADHIKLLHALRARDEEWAKAITENFFLRMCSILEERENITMTDVVYRALRERAEQNGGEDA